MLKTNLCAFKHLNKSKVTLISKLCCCQKAIVYFLVAHQSQKVPGSIPASATKIHSRCFQSFVLKTLQQNASGVDIKKKEIKILIIH